MQPLEAEFTDVMPAESAACDYRRLVLHRRNESYHSLAVARAAAASHRSRNALPERAPEYEGCRFTTRIRMGRWDHGTHRPQSAPNHGASQGGKGAFEGRDLGPNAAAPKSCPPSHVMSRIPLDSFGCCLARWSGCLRDAREAP
jgi:hypothetical protein